MSELNYGLSELALEIRSMVREFAESRVKPVRAELDETGHFPTELLKELGKMDLMGLYIPVEYGGTFEGDSMPNLVAVEELSRVCIGVSVSYAASGLGADPILIGGSEEQKKKYLAPLASGEKWAAYALTEPNAGSDAGSIRTTAVKKGDKYVLNGTKQWITNGGEADIYTVFAVTDKNRGARGVSCFIVEKGHAGIHLRQEGGQDGHPGERDARTDLRGLRSAGGKSDRARGDGLHLGDEDLRRVAAGHRGAGGGPGAGRAGRVGAVRQGARAVRQADHRQPGPELDAGGHGHEGGDGPGADLCGGQVHRRRREGLFRSFRRCARCMPRMSPCR